MHHNTAPSISLPLSLIFNFSFPTGIFPLDWKTPISYLFSNQKPLLHPLQTIAQSLYFPSQVRSWNNILSNCHFGFRPGFSTETAILSTINSWFSSLDYKNAVCAVFFDLTKAFDSIPHKPLLDSLSLLNLPPLLLSWLHSYLQGHTQQVIINVSLSSKSQVTSGVPKDSILGPPLFIIYINDIAKLSLLSSATLTLYADDILLSQEISSTTSMSTVQSNINLITLWITSHHFTINSKINK